LSSMWRVARWLIALGEIGGGVFMLSLVLHPPSTGSGEYSGGWTLFFAEGLGVAATVAGVNLLRNTPSGYPMSFAVQAIQILRIYGGRFIFAVIIGPQILINFIAAPGSIPMGGPLGFAATLYAAVARSGAMNTWAQGIGINVLALVASGALLVRLADDAGW
jgi:hypothetical protein